MLTVREKLNVLIFVKIQEGGETSAEEEWIRYMKTDLPSLVESIDVDMRCEGVYSSTSGLLLLSIPIEVYQCLNQTKFNYWSGLRIKPFIECW